jgi:hypothetical protein
MALEKVLSLTDLCHSQPPVDFSCTLSSSCSFTNICLTKFYFDWMIVEKIACFILSMLSDDGQLSVDVICYVSDATN